MASTSGSHMWSLQILQFLQERIMIVGLMVLNGYTKLADQATYNNLTQAEKDALREQRKKYGKALFYIHQAMHESILPRVSTKINAKQAWDTLETAYQGLGKVNNSKLQIQRRDLESMSMND